MEIKRIIATEKIEECWDLLQAHRDELTTNKELMVLKPDVPKYLALEAAGCLISLALYDGDKIVGYSVNIVTRNLHYADLVYMHNDIIFLDRDYRGGRMGLKLITDTEEAARAEGSKIMLFHAKQNTPFEAILRKMGYGVQDIMFSKVL